VGKGNIMINVPSLKSAEHNSLQAVTIKVFGHVDNSGLAFGVSTHDGGAIIHLDNSASPEDITTAKQILAQNKTLDVQTTKLTIQADDTDETIITCVGLSSFDSQRARDGIIEDESRINDGSIEFTAYSPGIYQFVIQEIGTYRTGYIEIEAIE
jgi:hypothetical protein